MVLPAFDFSLPGRLAGAGPLSFFRGARSGSGQWPLVLVSIAVLCAAVLLDAGPMQAAQSKSTQARSHHTAGRKKSRASRRQTAPDPERIKEIQGALAREGYYHGEATGKWDEATTGAMKNFQQANGLQPTGKIEALSLQKLGLGSPVAGVAAPTPQPPASGPPQKP